MPVRDDQKQISVRFDQNLYEFILARAKRNKRTFNAELNAIVEDELGWNEGKSFHIDTEKGEDNRA